jgi:hypothetical protein
MEMEKARPEVEKPAWAMGSISTLQEREIDVAPDIDRYVENPGQRRECSNVRNDCSLTRFFHIGVMPGFLPGRLKPWPVAFCFFFRDYLAEFLLDKIEDDVT